MVCPQCKINPRSHNFTQFGELSTGTKLWYTAAGKAEELVDTPTKFGYFKLHLDKARTTQWLWIFDCNGMTKHQQSSVKFMYNLVAVLSNEHAALLQGIWILHPSI